MYTETPVPFEFVMIFLLYNYLQMSWFVTFLFSLQKGGTCFLGEGSLFQNIIMVVSYASLQYILTLYNLLLSNYCQTHKMYAFSSEVCTVSQKSH